MSRVTRVQMRCVTRRCHDVMCDMSVRHVKCVTCVVLMCNTSVDAMCDTKMSGCYV